MNLQDYLTKTENYLKEILIPFWAERAVEPKYGGFQTNYNVNGNRNDVTEKNLLCQARCIFTISHSARLGFPWPNQEKMLSHGIDFLFNNFKNKKQDVYYWILSEDGKIIDDSIVIYGHSFLIYGLSEYSLLTGDQTTKNEAIRIFDLLQKKVKDKKSGGYFEHYDRNFDVEIVRSDNQIHKSLDVHMHLMEAFTVLYELTGDPKHKQALEEVIDLIFNKTVDPKTGVGMAMFTAEWQPINNVQLGKLWGRDRFEDDGKPPEITSYGHNIELAWLYLHALDILGISKNDFLDRVVPIFDHTYKNGVDWENGGIFVEGHREGEVTEKTKEFWQQGEAMVGFLDAYLLTKDEKYLKAFQNVHNFVFDKMINWEQGDWYALLETDGKIIWDYMGSSWKIFYHTVRATCLIVRKLEEIIDL